MTAGKAPVIVLPMWRTATAILEGSYNEVESRLVVDLRRHGAAVLYRGRVVGGAFTGSYVPWTSFAGREDAETADACIEAARLWAVEQMTDVSRRSRDGVWR